ncbi:MAG: hypothetical protein JWO40_830 [Candidatus Doudnabacteria bacterium]|nr:hypothetical protein [Candidatus Doudnabacteria bacterium]
MILETKITKKTDKRLKKLSPIVLGIFFAFFVLFVALNPILTARAEDVSATSSPNAPFCDQSTGANGSGAVPVTKGLSIYTCAKSYSSGGYAAPTLQQFYRLFLDGKPYPTRAGSATLCDCSVAWLLDGKPAGTDLVEIPGPYITAGGFHSQTISASVTKNGATTSTTKDSGKIDAAAPTDQGSVTDTLIGFISTVIRGIVLIIASALYGITHYLTIPVIQVVLDMKVHDSSFSAVILGGWVFVRNVMNIFFILAMLVIALATLFRIEGFEKKYNYKHLIPELVLMAILVNFSLVIAQLILGIADTVQAQFLPNNQTVLSNLAYQMMVRPTQILNVVPFKGSFSDVIAAIFYLFFALAAFFAFMALAAFLVIRVVALWILLLLSPVAYGLRVIPDLHHEASKWWTYFLKYAFFTPIIAFFLQIAATLTIKQSEYLAAVTQNSIKNSVNQNLGQFIELSLSCITIIFFLYMAIEVAQGFGVVGVGAIVKKAEHLTIKPFEFAGEATKNRVVREKNILSDKLTRDSKGQLRGGFSRAAATALRPKMAVKEFLHVSEEKNKEAADIAAAGVKTNREFNKSKTDNKADLGVKGKIHDEEIASALKTKVADAVTMTGNQLIRDEIKGGNHHTIEKVANTFEAMATNGRIEAYVTRLTGGAYTQDNLNKVIKDISRGNAEAEHEIRAALAKGGKKGGSLLAATADKTGTARDIAMQDIVDNTEPAEVNKINVTGVDPNVMRQTLKSIQNLVLNSGKAPNQLTSKLQVFIGHGDQATAGIAGTTAGTNTTYNFARPQAPPRMPT